MRNSYILVGKREGKRPLGRPRRRWENNIKVNLKEIGLEGMDWIHMAGWGPVASSCELCNEPSGSIKGGQFLD
jgi:hypothetical protein